MQIFYTNDITGQNAVLGEEESRHCVKVLRKNIGDCIWFIDGKGNKYKGKIQELHKKGTWLKILEKESVSKWNYHIHLAVAPTKNINRMEWMVEKCIEIGVDEVSFLQCHHSERNKLRLDRMEKIALSATKQSLKAHLPIINPLIPFTKFLREVADIGGSKYICWVEEEKIDFLDIKKPFEQVIIMIGPEGGFSKDEISLAINNGFQTVGLGNSRLRTETAGMVACHSAHIAQQLYSI